MKWRISSRHKCFLTGSTKISQINLHSVYAAMSIHLHCLQPDYSNPLQRAEIHEIVFTIVWYVQNYILNKTSPNISFYSWSSSVNSLPWLCLLWIHMKPVGISYYIRFMIIFFEIMRPQQILQIGKINSRFSALNLMP